MSKSAKCEDLSSNPKDSKKMLGVTVNAWNPNNVGHRRGIPGFTGQLAWLKQ